VPKPQVPVPIFGYRRAGVAGDGPNFGYWYWCQFFSSGTGDTGTGTGVLKAGTGTR